MSDSESPVQLLDLARLGQADALGRLLERYRNYLGLPTGGRKRSNLIYMEGKTAQTECSRDDLN